MVQTVQGLNFARYHMRNSVSLWLLVLAIASSSVVCKRYVVHQNWTLKFGFDRPYTYQKNANHAYCYSFITNGTTAILSDDGTFSLALLDSQCSYSMRKHGILYSPSRLAVLMQSGYDAVPVWTTSNSLDPKHPFQNLFAGTFNTVELDDSGSLALILNNTVVWRSTDYPINILLPGQRLRTGQTLRSQGSFNEEYIAQVSNSGFILWVRHARDESLAEWIRIPYGIWSFEAAGQTLMLDSASHNICDQGYDAILTYTGTELLLTYEAVDNTSSVCQERVPPLKLLGVASSNSSQGHRPYLELNTQGDIVLYKFDQTGWVVASRLSGTFGGRCRLPFPCSTVHNVCDGENKCRPTHFYWNKDFEVGGDLEVTEGTNYFATKYKSSSMELETIRNMSLERCKETVHGSSGAVYDKHTRDCLFIDELWGGLYADESTVNLTAIQRLNRKQMSDLITRGEVSYAFMILGGFASLCILVALVKDMLIRELRLMKYRIIIKFNKAIRDTEALLSTMQGLPRRYTYMELDSATKGFTTKLGAGGFGSVYEGNTCDGRHVAVKKLVSTAGGAQATKQFVTEVVGVGGVSHVNIVKLYGFCVEGTNKKLLVYEFMPNGSLDRWIFGVEKTLTWEQRFNIALGTARGLAYLHEECSEPILHLDIKPQNILLDEKFVPKVADFGMAKLLANRDVTQTETGVRGTIGYLAPEWFMRSVATKKCDVYSYGMVLLEVIGGRKNVDLAKISMKGGGGESDWYFPSWVVNRVKNGEILKVLDDKVLQSVEGADEDQMVMMVRIALWCIQDTPSMRPNMQEIVEMLQGHKSVEEPPMSFHFDAAEPLERQSITDSSTM